MHIYCYHFECDGLPLLWKPLFKLKYSYVSEICRYCITYGTVPYFEIRPLSYRRGSLFFSFCFNKFINLINDFIDDS